jgi:hypothetical protein
VVFAVTVLLQPLTMDNQDTCTEVAEHVGLHRIANVEGQEYEDAISVGTTMVGAV